MYEAFSFDLKFEYSLKTTKETENKDSFQNVVSNQINCFEIHKGIQCVKFLINKIILLVEKGIIVLGFENGSIGFLHLNDEKSKENDFLKFI